MDVVVTHENADFDAVASLVAAGRLFPSARLARPPSLNRNVREFVGVHQDVLPLTSADTIDLDDVSRLVVVETARRERLGRFASLLGREGVEVFLFDHHSGEPPDWVAADHATVTDDGALTTSLVSVLAERGLTVSPAEATLLALGIHEDTLSLTASATTERDVEALGWCLRNGASQGAVSRYLHRLLDAEHRELFEILLDSAEVVGSVRGSTVLVSAEWPEYVDDVSSIATKLLSVLGSDALVCLVQMDDRTLLVVRTTDSRLDASTLAGGLGGGGHPAAASAMLREPLASARKRVLEALPRAIAAEPTAAEIMSGPTRFVAPDERVDDAMKSCQRHHQGAIFIGTPAEPSGAVTREDLDRALAHGLASAPVRAIARPIEDTCAPDADLTTVQRLLAHTSLGRIPVVDGVVVGVVTRGDLLRALGRPAGEEVNGADLLVSASDRLGAQGELRDVFDAAVAASGAYRGVYLVGGAVRDLLLGEAVTDVDIAVEGDGIAFARTLGSALGGRVVPHDRFGTAVIVHGQGRVDVATTRAEFYEEPAALPAVEGATIRQDLGRRDFTVNAMAVSLGSDDYGRLVDPFGGRQDLEDGVVRVLHGLSFIDDPTRIFRAVRYESRYRFRMDPHTEALARTCMEMGFVGELSAVRIRDELVALLEEKEILAVLTRLEDLDLARWLQPELDVGSETRRLVVRLDDLRAAYLPAPPAWRLRFAAMARRIPDDARREWQAALKLRRRDAEKIDEAVQRAGQVVDALGAVAEPFEARELIAGIDPDGVLLSLALEDDGVARRWLERYVDELRAIELDISGTDVASMGLAESPEVGLVMRELLRLKVNGELDDRAAELATARRLIAETARDDWEGPR